MSKRVKPVSTVPAIHSMEEADATLAFIAARKRELTLMDLGLKEDVAKLKVTCAEQCEPIKRAIAEHEQALLRFAESHKTELFAKKKSVSLPFGVMGFRLSSSVKTLKKKITWEYVLGILKELQLTDCIRVKEEVDKDALRKLSPEQLAKVQCKLVEEDAFYYELAETDITGDSA